MGIKSFKTDPNIEKSGIVLDYADEGFRVTVARAGGANKRFQKLLEAKTKPHKRAMQTGTMSNERALDILKEVYAATVILNWETVVDDKYKVGIEDLAGGDKLLPVNPENVLTVLRELPELWTDIQDQASQYTAFKQEILEEDAKN